MIWVGLFAAVIYMISGLNPTQAKPDELDYNSNFLQLVRNTESADTTQKTIKAIMINDRKVYGLYVGSTSEMKDLPKKAEFLTVLPSETTFRADMAAIVYLIQKGYLKRTPRGRMTTKKAYDLLGLPCERNMDENQGILF